MLRQAAHLGAAAALGPTRPRLPAPFLQGSVCVLRGETLVESTRVERCQRRGGARRVSGDSDCGGPTILHRPRACWCPSPRGLRLADAVERCWPSQSEVRQTCSSAVAAGYMSLARVWHGQTLDFHRCSGLGGREEGRSCSSCPCSHRPPNLRCLLVDVSDVMPPSPWSCSVHMLIDV